MGFGPFVLLSLFYALLGIRVVVQLATRWRVTFDSRFTAADRALVDQAAFFVLVPIAVALHELGHAVAIRVLGGRVEGWGYYLFAGYVSFDPTDFTRAERILFAAAGTIVNVLLAAGAVALVFARRPPMRAAFNGLLLHFRLPSLINALVVYPLLDLVSGLNGDWTQMYRGGVPALSAAIFAAHAGILGFGFWAWRSGAVQGRIAALTGAHPGRSRGRLASYRAGSGPGGAHRDADAVLREAAGRVASGWPRPLDGVLERRPEGLRLTLSWRSGGVLRSVAAVAGANDEVQLLGAAGVDRPPATPGAPTHADPAGRAVVRRTAPLDADALTLALRVAMEEVDALDPTAGRAAP